MIVAVIENLSGFEKDGSYSTSKGDGWEMFDAGVASQTVGLAAYEKGVGSVILGIFDQKKIREHVSLPENEKITNLIAIGYPLDVSKNAPARKEVDELLEIIE